MSLLREHDRNVPTLLASEIVQVSNVDTRSLTRVGFKCSLTIFGISICFSCITQKPATIKCHIPSIHAVEVGVASPTASLSPSKIAWVQRLSNKDLWCPSSIFRNRIKAQGW